MGASGPNTGKLSGDSCCCCLGCFSAVVGGCSGNGGGGDGTAVLDHAGGGRRGASSETSERPFAGPKRGVAATDGCEGGLSNGDPLLSFATVTEVASFSGGAALTGVESNGDSPVMSMVAEARSLALAGSLDR